MARSRIKNSWSTFRSEVRQKYCRARGKQILHFLHVSKTGGTAIKYVLKQHRTTPEYAIVLHGHRKRLRDVPEGDKVIFCLRDPISRFVSGFYSRLRQGRPRYFVRWSKDEEIAFKNFDTPNQLALALSSTDNARRIQAERAMGGIFHVKHSYTKWFESEEYLLSRLSDIFLIGFQETLTDDFELLKNKLGLTTAVQLPTDEVTAHRNSEHFDKTLDAEAIDNLKRWYAEDYKLFGLCRQVSNLNSQNRTTVNGSPGAIQGISVPI